MKKLITILCVIALIGSVGYMANYFIKTNSAEKSYEEIKEMAVTEETIQETEQSKEPVQEEIEEIEEIEEKKPVEIPIDFASLKEKNSDIYAWITIPGTKVDYPILQKPEDDSYYLNHTVDGVEGLPGSIYTESVHNQEFTESNTVIYGHNMKDDTMFGSLHDYEKADFFKDNRTVCIYTPTNIFTYEIFAAVTYSDAYIPFAFDFTSDEGYQAFLDSVYESKNMTNQFAEDVEVTTEDCIITMSTCIGGKPNNRYLVLAVLKDVQ